METSDSPVPRPPPFQSMPTTSDTSHSLFCTCRVKGAIDRRLHPNNINRDSGIEIPEAWMPTIKKTRKGEPWDSGPPREQITEWKRKGSKCTNQSCWKTTYHSRASCLLRSRMTSRLQRRKKSKRRYLYHTWQTKKLSFHCYSPRWITTTFFTKLTDIYFSWILKVVHDYN